MSDGTHYSEAKYDMVFGPDSSQEDVFAFVRSGIEGSLKGYNFTLFAYGQTGSGKTYTMFGESWEDQRVYRNRARGAHSIGASLGSRAPGLVPLAVSLLFPLQTGKAFTCYCSFMQIYNEKVYDLLQDPMRSKALTVREDREEGIYVEKLAEYVVQTAEDCLGLLSTGERNRAVRETRYNAHSSRSHTIFQLLLESDKANKRGTLKRGKLNLCDLAGSEKYDKQGSMAQAHVRELTNINQSLLTLGKVVAALALGKGYAPYRESKLTRLLQDSLGANTRTILIATITPTM